MLLFFKILEILRLILDKSIFWAYNYFGFKTTHGRRHMLARWLNGRSRLLLFFVFLPQFLSNTRRK